MTRGIRNRFEDIWKYITITYSNKCWEWTGSKDKNGYGKFKVNRKDYRSHRIAYELTYGQIPEKLFVLHQCNNPSCCNSNHLKIGNTNENMKQMIVDNRSYHPRGELANMHKLKQEHIRTIRHLYSLNLYTQKEIGEQFGVSQSNISYIINKTWRHI